jgi:hypothetical protein
LSQRKLDLFELLRAADRCDGAWLSQQPDDAQKEFTPLVAQRFAVTVPDGPEAAYMLWVVNERVNGHLYVLNKHPDLVYRLLASCGIGQPKKHQWLAGPARTGAGNAAIALLLTCYPEANNMEIDYLLKQYDNSGFLQFVDECGIQPTDAKDIMKAYAKVCRNTNSVAQ